MIPYKTLMNALVISTGLLTSCATVVGGQKYYAHIKVENDPSAKIIYKGEQIGQGNATVKVKRQDADKFSFSVKQEGCPEQKYAYKSKTFRGWALAGTIVLFTGAYQGIPLPWGVAVDLAAGSLWKPNIHETGVSKKNYKNFRYTVSYYGCKNSTPEKETIDVIYLKTGESVKGKIIERSSVVKIRVKSGTVFLYSMEKIERIAQESDQ